MEKFKEQPAIKYVALKTNRIFNTVRCVTYIVVKVKLCVSVCVSVFGVVEVFVQEFAPFAERSTAWTLLPGGCVRGWGTTLF